MTDKQTTAEPDTYGDAYNAGQRAYHDERTDVPPNGWSIRHSELYREGWWEQYNKEWQGQ